MTGKMLDGWQALLEERLLAYDLLRRVYLEEPSRVFLKLLVENRIMSDFPFAEEEKLILEGCSEINTYLESNDVLSEAEYQKLHWDYTKMFVGPDKLLAPPWESAYTSKERLLFQETTLEVRRIYLKYNFLPKNYPHEADDHIGFELEFMYLLIKQTLESLEQHEIQKVSALVEEQKNFLAEHLQPWIADFSEQIIAGAKTPFYKGMAKILEGFIKLDNVMTEELLQSLRGNV